MSEELVHQLALELIPGIGPRGIKQLISYCGSAKDVFLAPKRKLLKIPGVGEKMASAIQSHDPFKEAEAIVNQALKDDIALLHYTNSQYPNRLKSISDSPNILFKKGAGDLNPEHCIAIVGTRKATKYGKEVTEQIVSELTSLNASIISGLAYGIDIAAHRSAIKHGLPTFAILAGGLDRIYPSTHKKYANQMLEDGGLLTESRPGVKPDPHLFPTRNRIVAGMADAIIVVEAAEKGGALITANLADSYDRPVFAIPGNLENNYSVGTNRLIATQKAMIYTGVQDLVFQLGIDLDHTDKKPLELPPLSIEAKDIYDILIAQGSPIEIDLLALKSQIPINKVAAVLLELEFENLVKSLPGKKFQATIRR